MVISYNNKIISYNNKWTNYTGSVDPYNPLNLPPNTVRVRTSDGNPPIKDQYTSYETATLVTGTTDVYDVYRSGTSFTNLLAGSTNLIEVLGANTTGIRRMLNMFSGCTSLISIPLFDTSNVNAMITMFSDCTSLISIPLFDTSNVNDMGAMFYRCSSLTTVPLFDTSNVNDMEGMFSDCTSLISIPLFDTSNVNDMTHMFYNCINVQSGALALYQQASTQTNPPTEHERTFYNCGRDTTTGAAELAQIPEDWK